MTSLTDPDFWRLYYNLPVAVRQLARKNYLLWQKDTFHPSLHFKPLHSGIWSLRIGTHHRAAGYFLAPDTFVWFWIGTHADYDRL